MTSIPSWASWTRLWPERSPVRDVHSGTSFDLSEVDLKNIPKPDCEEWINAYGCNMWKRHPKSGIAGFHRDYNSLSSGRAAMQIKETLIPDDVEEREALKEKLYPGYDYERRENSLEIELIPVKYDFGELWRWATILNRFAVSSGNTIGIESAYVHNNRSAYYGIRESVLLLDDLGPGEYEDSSTIRETVAVYALDARRVAEALPELLPLLGIPVDAVGILGTVEQGYFEVVAE